MESQPATTGEAELPALVDRPILRRARALVLWALGAAVLYSSLVASRGSCPGGFSADGGFLDANGDATTVQPQCVQLVLQPSPVVYLAIAVTVVIALGRAARAADVEAALLTLKRAAFVAVGIAVVSMLVAILWFQGMPLPTGRGTVLFPFPFGGGTMTVIPQESGHTG
jgi:hypothetical protein